MTTRFSPQRQSSDTTSLLECLACSVGDVFLTGIEGLAHCERSIALGTIWPVAMGRARAKVPARLGRCSTLSTLDSSHSWDQAGTERTRDLLLSAPTVGCSRCIRGYWVYQSDRASGRPEMPSVDLTRSA